MRALLLLFLLGSVTLACADDDFEKDAQWITGQVFAQKDFLFFRLSKPVQGNPAGNVVFLGATKDAMNVLLPCYSKAADKQMMLRLYGVLCEMPEGNPAHLDPMPNVQFVTWKMHMPSDPDVLPDKDKMTFGPNDSVPGYKVEAASPTP